MNKLVKGLFAVSLAAVLVGAAACGTTDSDAWKGTDFTGYGAVRAETLGGFSAETDKYVYFINGIGSSTADNTFGKPIKGALVAADKNDLSKTQVVIPELFVASDYNAGLFIAGSGEDVYAYYGTPNKDKDASGAVAYSEMTFTKTRLDGKKSEKLFTISSLSANYRIAAGEDGTVYIVYYDTASSSLISFNCSTKKSEVIAKTDAENNDANQAGEYVSLGEYKFADANVNAAQVVYTLTVYSQKYYAEQAADEESYSRQTAAYNYVYTYTAGKGSEKLLDGSAAGGVKYTLSSVSGEYLFYTQSKYEGTATTCGVKISDGTTAVKLDYPDGVKDGMIVRNLSEVYFADNNKVVKTSLVKGDGWTAQDEFENLNRVIAAGESVSSLIAVKEDYVYYFNSDNYIVAAEKSVDGSGKEIRVSERTASQSWYVPEIISIESGDYLLYCDNSSDGNSYVYYAALADLADPATETEEDDTTVYYLNGTFIGVMPAADRAAVVTAKLNAIESTLEFDEGTNGLYSESVNAARIAYDALDSDAKSLVSESAVNKLTYAEKAVALANAFDKLEPAKDYKYLTEEQKTALAEDYAAAKTLAESYGSDYDAIAAYLNGNLKFFYQQAAKELTPAESES